MLNEKNITMKNLILYFVANTSLQMCASVLGILGKTHIKKSVFFSGRTTKVLKAQNFAKFCKLFREKTKCKFSRKFKNVMNIVFNQKPYIGRTLVLEHTFHTIPLIIYPCPLVFDVLINVGLKLEL